MSYPLGADATSSPHESPAQAPDDPAPPPSAVIVRKNARVRLRNADDRCITAFESATRCCCAKMGNQALTLLLDGGDRPLTHGRSLSIRTTGVWNVTWKARTLLGVFGDVHQLCCWDDYGSRTNGIVEKPTGRTGDAIHVGDKVWIRNEADADQHLSTHKTHRQTWAFEPGG
jgi:hypothetical protein